MWIGIVSRSFTLCQRARKIKAMAQPRRAKLNSPAMNCGPLTASPSAPVVGVGAVVWKDGRILLIKRGRPPRLGSWSLPGGRQELGETVYQTARREIREETGVDIRILDIAGVVDLIDRVGEDIRFHYTVIDVVALWLSGEAVAGDDAAAVVWVAPERLSDYGVTEAVSRIVATAGLRLAELTAGGAP